MNITNKDGVKIGYIKDGKSVFFDNAPKEKSAAKFESKSGARVEVVMPKDGQKFQPFQTVFAWKTTKRFGMINVNARKQLDQKKLDGSKLKEGYEKWVIELKTATTTETIFGLYSTKKHCIFFDMGTTKCCIDTKKGFFSFIQPKYVTDFKKRR